MKILARQLTLDLYNCNDKKFTDAEAIKTAVEGVFGSEVKIISTNIDNEHFGLVAAFTEGHIALHIYKLLKYVSVDIFTCSESDESDELSKSLSKYFQQPVRLFLQNLLQQKAMPDMDAVKFSQRDGCGTL